MASSISLSSSPERASASAGLKVSFLKARRALVHQLGMTSMAPVSARNIFWVSSKRGSARLISTASDYRHGPRGNGRSLIS
jgi:hypothetical protein